MTKLRNLAALVALSGAAVLPACSMFGGNSGSDQVSRAVRVGDVMHRDRGRMLPDDVAHHIKSHVDQGP